MLQSSSSDEEEPPKEEEQEDYVSFSGRQTRAVLYKLAPMSDPVKAEMTKYVHEGHMQKDLRFAREVFGRTNTSGRKDFLDFWESPWVEVRTVHTNTTKHDYKTQLLLLMMRWVLVI